MQYLVEASILIAIFYTIYRIFLRRDTLFLYHRWYFLIGLLLALCLPFLELKNYVEYTSIENFAPLSYTSTPSLNSPETIEKPFDWLALTNNIYLAGALFFAARFLLELTSFIKLLINNKINYISGVGYITLDTDLSPFSFLNWIIYNPRLFSEVELNLILRHEKVHIDHGHSVDVLIVKILSILMWFNPFIWLYKRDLFENLEFAADKVAQQDLPDRKIYQFTLLKTGISNINLPMGNTFYSSKIKNRIVMLQKSRSRKINLIKYLICVPIIAILLMSFKTKTIYVEKPTTKVISADTTEYWNVQKFVITPKTTDSQIKIIKDGLTKENVEINFGEISRDSNKNLTAIKIVYKSKGSSGQYQIKEDEKFSPIALQLDVTANTLSIGRDSTSNLSHTIPLGNKRVKIPLKRDSVLKTEKRVIRATGQKVDMDTVIKEKNTKIITSITEKGNVFVVDTVFTNSNPNPRWSIKEDGGKIIAIGKVDELNSKNALEKPLIIIDGKTMDYSNLEEIDPNNIVSVNVYKDDIAEALYSGNGKNGVIIIKTNASPNSDGKFEYEFETDDDKTQVSVASDEDFLVNTIKRSEQQLRAKISKNMPDQELDKIEDLFANKNLELNFSRLKRNRDGFITRIKITLANNKGQKTEVSYKTDDGIPNVYLGENEEGLFIDAK